VQKRRAPVVGKSEIQPIFANLKYKFRSLGLSLDDLDGLMFPLSFWQHFSSEEEASVRIVELIGMLSSYPFQLGEDDSELVARYLVEDNDEGFVLVDWDLSTKVARVRSILRNLMQNYDLFKDRDEIESEIAKLMNKQLLLDHLNRLPSSASGICSQQEFFETLLYLDLQLPGRFQEYLCQKNYEMTDSITDFHFNKLVDYFCSI
jgi:hypothetical protein